MPEKLRIVGERYTGEFVANRLDNEFWVGNEYYTAKHKGHYYGGTGLIIDNQTGEAYSFAIQTTTFDDSQCEHYSLEEAIVNYNQKGPFYVGDFKPELINPAYYKKIVDISFEKIISKIKNSKDKIPIITPEKLKLEDLVRMGIVFSSTGQTHLPISST